MGTKPYKNLNLDCLNSCLKYYAQIPKWGFGTFMLILQLLKDTVKKNPLINLTKMPNPVRTALSLSGLFTTISCKIYIWTIGCINNNCSCRKWHFPYTDFV